MNLRTVGDAIRSSSSDEFFKRHILRSAPSSAKSADISLFEREYRILNKLKKLSLLEWMGDRPIPKSPDSSVISTNCDAFIIQWNRSSSSYELQDANGEKVKDGELGEVVIILPKDKPQIGLFSSYLDNSEQYQYAFRGGVYHTGDVAYKDANGKYWYHGRFDDLIKTGGFRVGPFEIEHILISHPAVLECSVIGVED